MSIQAAKRNLVYPGYAWMIYAWYPEKWWEHGEPLEGCSNDMLEDFLIKSRAHVINILPEADDHDEITASGMVNNFLK